MKLIETYANNVGVKLPQEGEKPYLSFHPTPEKYITIHTSSGMKSKNYDYFQEVINLTANKINKSGYKILQIGKSDDELISQALDLRSKTTLYQSNFIIKNSSLHLGNDSVWTHVAGLFDTPCISLYGPTIKNVCSPYYSNKNSTYIESHRKNKKASHSFFENPKTINFINPEEIANAIFRLLGIESKVGVETIFIGKHYNKNIIELIPNHSVPSEIFTNGSFNLRADLHFDLKFIEINLAQRNCGLVTCEPIPRTTLEKFKDRIKLLFYKCDENPNIEFIKDLESLNIKYSVVTEEKDQKLQQLKLDLFDFNPPLFIKSFDKNSIGNYSRIENNKTIFKTSKILLSQDGIFLSDWHWKNKKKQTSLSDNIGILEKDMDSCFYKNMDHYFIFNHEII